MTELESIKIKFEEIYKDRPSTLRSSLFYGIIGWIGRIAGSILFIIGIGLLIATTMGAYLFSLPDTDNQISNMPEAYESLVLLIQVTAGSLCTFLGLVLLFIARLSRRITTRNSYIQKIEELFPQQTTKKG